MRRRRFLAALGVATGLAGCSATPDPGSSETPTLTPVEPPETASETPTPSETPEGDSLGALGAASVVDLRTVDRTYALAPTRYRADDAADVRLAFVTTATADHPARVRATLRNAAEWPNTFRLDETPPFGRPLGGLVDGGRELRHRAALLFAPTEANAVATHAPAVERASDGTWRLADEIDSRWAPGTVRLGAGETVTGDWWLVGRPEGVEAGRPPGRYTFEASEASLSVSVWNTDRPGPTDYSRFTGRTVPPLPRDASVDWYHDAGPTTPAYLVPDTERTDFPGAVGLTLYNHTHGALSGNSWKLYKLHEGTWYQVEPWVHNAVLRRIPSGGRREYELRAFNGDPLPCDGAISVGYLGGGTYAFESMFGSEGGLGNFAALLELAGPPVSVVPTDDATATRDGSTVEVRWPTRPELPRATLTVERLDDDAADADRFIAEQVMRARNDGLRNTLAFVESGVDRVVLRTDRNTVSRASGASGYEPATRRIRFEGEAYELTSTFDDGTNATQETATGTR